MPLTSDLIPPEGIPVFRFEDGWTWNRTISFKPLAETFQEDRILFRLFGPRGRSMLRLSTKVSPVTSIQGTGEGLLALESADAYRRRLLPFWTQVMNLGEEILNLRVSDHTCPTHPELVPPEGRFFNSSGPDRVNEVWVEEHSARGNLLIDFNIFDLLGQRHPVVDTDERFIPWGEMYMEQFTPKE